MSASSTCLSGAPERVLRCPYPSESAIGPLRRRLLPLGGVAEGLDASLAPPGSAGGADDGDRPRDGGAVPVADDVSLPDVLLDRLVVRRCSGDGAAGAFAVAVALDRRAGVACRTARGAALATAAGDVGGADGGPVTSSRALPR